MNTKPPSKNSAVELALIRKDVDMITTDITAINTKLDAKFVSKDEFAPVKLLVYGATSLMLVMLLTAIVGLALMRGAGA